MKKILVLVCLGFFIMSIGCAIPYMPGMAYSNMKGPITTSGKAAGSKVGTAGCVTYGGVYAAGDASIAAAAENGGIKRIYTVDYEFINYSPFYLKTTTVVTGE